MAVAPGVREPFQQDQADPLGPRRAVRVGGERLAPAVGSQAALTRELHEHAGLGHHGRAAREGEHALAAAQRLGGQVHGDQ